MLIEIENECLKVGISSSGAELRAVNHKKNNVDYMWTGDDTYWGRVSPVLFPIVGRLKNDQYRLNGKTYTMSQHGFLRDAEFHLDQQTSTDVSFVCKSAGRFTDVYPFEFDAYIRYTLEEDSLTIGWEIVNLNQETMYFSIGAHPAFNVPLQANETMKDYHIELKPAVDKRVTEYEIKNALVYEKGSAGDISSIPLSDSLFINDALIYSHIDSIKLISSKSDHCVEVDCKNFPYVGIWSKYMEEDATMAPFVCIEPWHGIADTHDTNGGFQEKKGINKLEVGEVFKTDYKITFA